MVSRCKHACSLSPAHPIPPVGAIQSCWKSSTFRVLTDDSLSIRISRAAKNTRKKVSSNTENLQNWYLIAS